MKSLEAFDMIFMWRRLSNSCGFFNESDTMRRLEAVGGRRDERTTRGLVSTWQGVPILVGQSSWSQRKKRKRAPSTKNMPFPRAKELFGPSCLVAWRTFYFLIRGHARIPAKAQADLELSSKKKKPQIHPIHPHTQQMGALYTLF